MGILEDSSNTPWPRPEGKRLFWIAGKRPFKTLPGDLQGTCTLGAVTPNSFVFSNLTMETQSWL